MTFQPVVMLVIGMLCFTSALGWACQNHPNIPAALAFLGFSIGYFALAALFTSP